MASEAIYSPEEDSHLLEKYVKLYASGKVLDMGTGSGIQAVAALSNPNVSSVLALDIQKDVIAHCKNIIKDKKISFVQSDLFSYLEKKKQKIKFDTIIFNPPYLPTDKKHPHPALDGGKHGYELTLRFIESAPTYLAEDGIILLLFSSLTKKGKIDEALSQNLLDFSLLEKLHISFEDLYVYRIERSALRKKIEATGIMGLSYLAKGKRGSVYRGTYRGRQVAVKIKNPKSEAHGTILHEAQMLQPLNKMGIGPTLRLFNDEFLAMDLIDGPRFAQYIEGATNQDILKALKECLHQLELLDRRGIEKEEMHHPHKHILMHNKQPVMIDFERAHFSRSPSNITQFCQYLTSSSLAPILKQKNINIDKAQLIMLAKAYKKEPSEGNFSAIQKAILNAH